MRFLGEPKSYMTGGHGGLGPPKHIALEIKRLRVWKFQLETINRVQNSR